MRHEEFSQYGSRSITTTAGSGDIECKGAAFVTFEALTVTSTPQVKVYGKLKSGDYKPIDYQKITAAGVWSSIDADTASGALSQHDRILVANPGFSHVRIVATTGSLTVATTLNPPGGLEAFLLQKLIDGGITATVDEVNAYGPLREVDVTLTLDTNAYADNDVLADSQIVAACVRANDAMGWLVGLRLLDEDDQAAFDFDLVLLSANASIGTENDPVSISDANARNVIGIVSVLQTENPSVDLVNNKVTWIGPNHKDMPVPIKPVSGADDIYVALILRSGTPTFTASGIRLRMFFKDA